MAAGDAPAEKSAEELETERTAAQAALQAQRSARPQTKVSHKKLNQVKVRPRKSTPPPPPYSPCLLMCDCVAESHACTCRHRALQWQEYKVQSSIVCLQSSSHQRKKR